ncbi:ATP-binding cassette domain-containing protein [Muricomes sp. OA1]|uniref:ATP-binding cassette domain-containing protein n=1 Tax=Hungatella hathewayi TaxID=154046 RepID=A0A3E2WYD0_9FIRM|nr:MULTISPECIES: ATP-binding cassette domain-containing protein [Clostridia]MBS6762675.1 ATP-binding cassette domain-containing protein [Clostridium sp.]MCH1973001.1 ATP-binding cassette domain-containing protein [Muricomes sp. OA1]RGC33330.1 ATP-binding cassette domain-containing protein [Hungatella hathewayi]GKH31775.1 ABC transporter ATP-binding protein [Faecalicatena contorta]
MEKPVMDIQNLTVRYGKTCDYCRNGGALVKNTCPRCKTVWACSDIHITLYEGEILGIVGESGSGKSTLMKSLYFDFDITEGKGYLRDFENGEADIFEQSLQRKKYIKNHIMGMVYQNPLLGLRMDYSGAGNIAEKLIAAGQRNFAGMNERVEELLDAVEILQSRKKEPPKNFSGGMQQRVQISKALANNPAILLLDEVTTGLDLSVQAKVLELIRRIRQEFHISIMLVSHDLAVIRMLADRTIVMLDGKIIEQGLTDQILDDPQQPYTQQLVHSLL